MRRLILLSGILALACSAFGQNVRFTAPFPSVSGGAPPYLVANIPPNSPLLSVCHSPANAVPCTNYATTYQGTGAACSNGAQDTPDPNALTSACQSTGDAQGTIGFWAPAGTYDYTVCISGTVSCFGPYTVTIGGSGGSTTCAGLLGIQCAPSFTGATADVQITNCIAALPANGGICDARGYGSTAQTIATCPLLIGAATKNVTLLINTGTQFGFTCSNPSDYGIHVWAGSNIRGEGTGNAANVNYEANFVALSGSSLKGLITNWPRIPAGNESVISLQNFEVRSNTGSAISEGLISLSGAFSGTTVANVGSTYCGGGAGALYITAPITGAFFVTSDLTFVNDNFDCGGATNSGHAVEIMNGGSVASLESINFYGSQAQHSALSDIDINGNGSVQCGSILFNGLHTENTIGLATTPAYVTINDCHNVTFDNWNTSGATPTAGNVMTVAQATPNATHDIFVLQSRFVSGTNVVSSSVAGLANLTFTAQADSWMSVEYYAGLPLAQNICTVSAPCSGTGGGNPILENCTPDQTGNSFYSVTSLTNYFAAAWQFIFNTTTSINCTVYIPAAQTGATVVIDIWSADATAGHTASITYADGVINSGTVNIGSLTSAASQTYTTTSTANNRVTLTFNVQSTLATGSILVVKIGTTPTGTAPTANLNVYPHFVL